MILKAVPFRGPPFLFEGVTGRKRIGVGNGENPFLGALEAKWQGWVGRWKIWISRGVTPRQVDTWRLKGNKWGRKSFRFFFRYFKTKFDDTAQPMWRPTSDPVG